LITDDYINIALYRIEEKIQSWDKDIPKIVSQQKLCFINNYYSFFIFCFLSKTLLSPISVIPLLIKMESLFDYHEEDETAIPPLPSLVIINSLSLFIYYIIWSLTSPVGSNLSNFYVSIFCAMITYFLFLVLEYLKNLCLTIIP
jgi:hypothetical protein